MTTEKLASLRQAVVDAANLLVRTGAISLSRHGNVSVRVPNLRPENLALRRDEFTRAGTRKA